jgi:hypothetical protein
VVLGVCGVKPAREGIWGTLGSVTGVHSSVYPYCDGFRSLCVGVLLADGGHELTPV